jgi:flagellar basal body-associated protein FliL
MDSSDTKLTSVIATDMSWFHNHLFLMVVILILIFGGFYGTLAFIERHDKANQDYYSNLLAQQTATSKVLQDKLTGDETHWLDIEKTLLAQNQALTNAISHRDQQTTQTIQKDSSLSVTEAALKLSAQVKAQSGEITTQGENLLVDLPMSRTIISNLDLLPSVQADLTDTKEQLNNQNTIIVNLRQNLTEEQDLTHSLDKQIVDQKNYCDAQIKTIKAKQRKTLLKVGAVLVTVGYVLGRVL